MNSDVVYLTGDTFMPDSCGCVNQMAEKLKNIPDIREDSLIISADKDSMADYMEEAYERNSRTLFNECVANLSRDAAFIACGGHEQDFPATRNVSSLICRHFCWKMLLYSIRLFFQPNCQL